jgi:hypothetical protein
MVFVSVMTMPSVGFEGHPSNAHAAVRPACLEPRPSSIDATSSMTAPRLPGTSIRGIAIDEAESFDKAREGKRSAA